MDKVTMKKITREIAARLLEEHPGKHVTVFVAIGGENDVAGMTCGQHIELIRYLDSAFHAFAHDTGGFSANPESELN